MKWKGVFGWVLLLGVIFYLLDDNSDNAIVAVVTMACIIRLSSDSYNLGFYRKKKSKAEKERQDERIVLIVVMMFFGFCFTGEFLYRFIPRMDGKHTIINLSCYGMLGTFVLFYLLGLLKGNKTYPINKKSSVQNKAAQT